MPQIVSTHPIDGIHSKRRPLYSYEFTDRDWKLISGAISGISQSSDAAAVIALAIEENRLQLHLQLVAPLFAGAIPKYEVLLRILEDDKPVSIGALLSKIDAGDSILTTLDRKVIALVCEQATPHVTYAVNLSGSTLSNFSTVEFIERQIGLHRVEAKHLMFEITEQALASPKRAEITIQGISKLGCPIALDDFGSGYSNGDYLCRFCDEIGTLKIDGALIRQLGNHCARGVLVGYLAIAAELNLDVVAEMVETDLIRQQVETLWRNHYPQVRLWIQGYSIGLPQKWASE